MSAGASGLLSPRWGIADSMPDLAVAKGTPDSATRAAVAMLGGMKRFVIVDAAMKVHTALGPGLLESAYEACLLFELHKRGLKAVRQVEMPVTYEKVKIDVGYRIDLLVEDTVVVELKSVEELLPVHQAQLLSYMKLSGKPVGLLINFNVPRLKDGLKRMINNK